jgi:hypothetical protein
MDELHFIVNIALDKQFLLNFVKILNQFYIQINKIKNKSYQFLENVDQLNSKIFVGDIHENDKEILLRKFV